MWLCKIGKIVFTLWVVRNLYAYLVMVSSFGRSFVIEWLLFFTRSYMELFVVDKIRSYCVKPCWILLPQLGVLDLFLLLKELYELNLHVVVSKPTFAHEFHSSLKLYSGYFSKPHLSGGLFAEFMLILIRWQNFIHVSDVLKFHFLRRDFIHRLAFYILFVNAISSVWTLIRPLEFMRCSTFLFGRTSFISVSHDSRPGVLFRLLKIYLIRMWVSVIPFIHLFRDFFISLSFPFMQTSSKSRLSGTSFIYWSFKCCTPCSSFLTCFTFSTTLLRKFFPSVKALLVFGCLQNCIHFYLTQSAS